jgi:hypothetical protein
MQTMGIKSAHAPSTIGIKQHRAPHTMGVKTHMVFRNTPPSAYTSEPAVNKNENLELFAPLHTKSKRNGHRGLEK